MKNDRKRGLGAAYPEQVQPIQPTLGEITSKSNHPSTPAAAGGTTQTVPAGTKSGVVNQLISKVQSSKPTGGETGIIGEKPL